MKVKKGMNKKLSEILAASAAMVGVLALGGCNKEASEPKEPRQAEQVVENGKAEQPEQEVAQIFVPQIGSDLSELARRYTEAAESETPTPLEDLDARTAYLSDPTKILLVSDGEDSIAVITGENQKFDFSPTHALVVVLDYGNPRYSSKTYYFPVDALSLNANDSTNIAGQITDMAMNEELRGFQTEIFEEDVSTNFATVLDALNSCAPQLAALRGNPVETVAPKCEAFRGLAEPSR